MIYRCYYKLFIIWLSIKLIFRVNLGDKVNTPGNETIPHITPDGKYLFYTSNRDIYWVSIEFVDKLKH